MNWTTTAEDRRSWRLLIENEEKKKTTVTMDITPGDRDGKRRTTLLL